MGKARRQRKAAGFDTWLHQMSRSDGWENTITGLGTSRDKRLGTLIKAPATSAQREIFEFMYAGDDIAAIVADLPANEMVREWFKVNVDDSADNEPGDAEGELRVEAESSTDDKVNVGKQVAQKLDDLAAQAMVGEALTWARVFGGGLLFLGVDDGRPLEEPLDKTAIKSFEFLIAFDRWEVHIETTVQDMGDPRFGKPELYRMQTQTETGIGSMQAQRVHASRFIRFDGVRTTRRRMASNGGWTDSIYIRIIEVLQDFGIAWHGLSHLLQDFAQAVLKMKGLAQAIASDNDDLVISRMQNMDLCRSVARAIPIDAENEDFTRVVTPVAGLADLMDRFSLRLSAAARMPVTLMMGMSPAGLNATGESDIRFFYDQIKAEQHKHLKPRLEELVELIFLAKDGPTAGAEPENWSITFNPLWQLSDVEQATVRKSQAETDAIYIINDVLTPDEVAGSRFGGDVYSTDTVLDSELRDGDAMLDGLSAEERARTAVAAASADPDAGGNGADPNAPPTPTPGDPPATDPATEGSAAEPSATLNGAQISALVQVVTAVIDGTLPKATAMQIVEAGFPLEPARIEALFADVVEGEPAPASTGPGAGPGGLPTTPPGMPGPDPAPGNNPDLDPDDPDDPEPEPEPTGATP